MDRLTTDPSVRQAFVEKMREEAFAQRDRARTAVRPSSNGPTTSAVKGDLAEVPAPPFWGARTIDSLDFQELWPCFDLRSLYRLSWGAANTKGEAFDRLVREEFEPRLRRYEREALEGGLLSPRVAYGYFPAAGEGNDVILYDPQDHAREIGRFAFARQIGGEHLSLADYVRAPASGRASDVVALQIVTVGTHAAERTEVLHAAGDYSESYFLHGFSVQSAEALAEWTHRRVRRELGLADERGKRYSWGYGACPELSQHELVFNLLDATNRIGVTLTEAFQIVPEQSTAAIVLHHPKAAYFNAAAVREQVATA
jgi:5-methyltetrahydrofolate--homocysteine methyltransferase